MSPKKVAKFFAFLLLIICSTSTRAQNQAAKFGKVDDSELAMHIFLPDSSAEAVILSDYGFSRFVFNGGTKLMFERHTRIKIINKVGYKLADISIPLYKKGSDGERLTAVKGFTYNLVDGKVTKDKLDTKAVYEEQHNENWSSKKFTMPNVKEGSVIEYSYTITSDFIYNLHDWEFQSTIPVVWSEYTVQMPQYFDYKFLQNGFHPYYSKDKNGNNFELDQTRGTYTWKMKDVPSLRQEAYMTTLDDYKAKIEFELQAVHVPGEASKTITGNWESETHDLLHSERFGRQLNRTGYFKNEVTAVAAKHSTPEEQMEALHDLVKKKVKWDGKFGIYTNSPLRKVYDSGTGSAAEINLMLIAMLQDAGLEAWPVLVSTRRHGRVYKGTPLLTKFNYVIAHVALNEKEYLLDATDPLLPAGMLPVQCLNGEGRLIKAKTDTWVQLKPSNIFSEYFAGEITISEKGEMLGTMTEALAGYSALNLRQTVADKGEKGYIENVDKEVGAYKRSQTSLHNLKDLAKPVEVKYKLEGNGNKQQNDIIYLMPMLGRNKKENPFKSKQRSYPIDFAAPVNETFVCRYMLPDGYVVDDKPKNVSVALPEKGGKFIYAVEQNGNAITVTSIISISKAVFQAQEYPHLQELYNQVVAKQAEQIVLKKQH